jgi:Flp pilus assembly CpaF family ATPase
MLNVRKFAVVPLTTADLLAGGAIGPRMLGFLAEVRGGEALDMLQAMNTGHDESLSTPSE